MYQRLMINDDELINEKQLLFYLKINYILQF